MARTAFRPRLHHRTERLDVRPLRTTDYAGECARMGVRPVDTSVPYPHWLGVPMRAGEHVLGGIAVLSADRPYTDADERLLVNAADLTALALRSARLYEERARAFSQLSAADQLVRGEAARARRDGVGGGHDFNNRLAAILDARSSSSGASRTPRAHVLASSSVRRSTCADGRRLQDVHGIRRDHPLVAVDLTGRA